MGNNVFIAFEGIDGSGKSTQAKMLCERLKNEGHKIYSTSEPTDGPIGSLIRNIFNHRIEADHKTIAGLFVADRLDHLLNKTNGLMAKMQEGYSIITDRYYFSSYAYQSSHVPLDWLIEANRMSADLLRPTLNIYIDIPPEVSMKRIANSRSSLELFETLDNLRTVREKYSESMQLLKDVENIFIVDGNRNEKEIAKDIWEKVSRLVS